MNTELFTKIDSLNKLPYWLYGGGWYNKKAECCAVLYENYNYVLNIGRYGFSIII